ncbi:PilZ domain-containing protein [Idiomarina tyrosinivorans]|nr:PilZ domain-containing protein [Idiomarina tyrosinivorans]
MSTTHYQQLVEQLKPIVNDPDFDAIFNQLTTGEEGAVRLQLKLELQRLAAPCNRTVDMRSKTTNECKAVEHNGRTHYLDPVSKIIFERGLNTYNGIFTQDTFEQIFKPDNPLRQRYQEEQEERQALQDANQDFVAAYPNAEADIDSYLVESFNLGVERHRHEERMNFSVDVTLATQKQKAIAAVTTDISLSGIRVKLKEACPINVEDSVIVELTGLIREFAFNEARPITYIVVGVEEVDGNVYWRLRRSEDEHLPEMDQFLTGFINGYKRRYKINVDNTEKTLLHQGLTLSFLPRLKRLPLFLNVRHSQCQAMYALATAANQAIVDDWRDDTNRFMINGIWRPHRVRELVEHGQLTLYCFSLIARGKRYFYSATPDELIKLDALESFLWVGQQKPSWRVYHLAYSPVDGNKALFRDSIPEQVDIASRRLAPSATTLGKVAQVNGMVVITNISDSFEQLADTDNAPESLEKVKLFAHKRSGFPATAPIMLSYTDIRQEHRFAFQTRCRISSNEIAATEALTVDISARGMRLALEQPLPLTKGENVTIDCYQLSQRHHVKAVTALQYEVVGVSADQSELHLRVFPNQAQHPGAKFFKRFIHHYKDRLTNNQSESLSSGLEVCLRQLYLTAPSSLPLFFTNKGRRWTLPLVGKSPVKTPWFNFLQKLPGSNDGYLNLQPLLRANALSDPLEPLLNHVCDDKAVTELLLFVHCTEHNGEWLLTTEYLRSSEHAKLGYLIDKGMLSGACRIIHWVFSPKAKVEAKELRAELTYLTQYAAHRADRIRETLSAVAAISDGCDITDSLLAIYGYNTAQRREAAQAWSHVLA